MKSVARRVRSKSPFARRRRADELITGIRQIMVESEELERVERLANMEAGVELILDLPPPSPPSPRIDVLSDRLSDRLLVDKYSSDTGGGGGGGTKTSSSNKTTVTASTTAETPSRRSVRSSTNKGNAATPKTQITMTTTATSTHSGSFSPEQSDCYGSKKQQSKSKSRESKLPKKGEQSPPRQRGRQRLPQLSTKRTISKATTASLSAQVDPEQAAVSGRNMNRLGVRRLLCQKYRPQNDIYNDNPSSTIKPARFVAPSKLITPDLAQTERSKRSSTPDRKQYRSLSPVPNQKKSKKKAGSRSRSQNKDRASTKNSKSNKPGGGSSGPRLLHRFEEDEDHYYDNGGGWSNLLEENNRALFEGKDEHQAGGEQQQQQQQQGIMRAPSSIRVRRNVSRVVSGLSRDNMSTANRSLGNESIAELRKALKNVQKQLAKSANSRSGSSNQHTRDSMIETLLQVASTLQSAEDREVLVQQLDEFSACGGDEKKCDHPHRSNSNEEDEDDSHVFRPLASEESYDSSLDGRLSKSSPAYRRRLQRAKRDGQWSDFFRDAFVDEDTFSVWYEGDDSGYYSSESGSNHKSQFTFGLDFLWNALSFGNDDDEDDENEDVSGNDDSMGYDLSGSSTTDQEDAPSAPKPRCYPNPPTPPRTQHPLVAPSREHTPTASSNKNGLSRQHQDSPKKNTIEVKEDDASSARGRTQWRNVRRVTATPEVEIEAPPRPARSLSAGPYSDSYRDRIRVIAPEHTTQLPVEAVINKNVKRSNNNDDDDDEDEDDSFSLGSIDSSQFQGKRNEPQHHKHLKQPHRVRSKDDMDLIKTLSTATPLTARNHNQELRPRRPSYDVNQSIDLLHDELPWLSSHHLTVHDEEFAEARNQANTNREGDNRATWAQYTSSLKQQQQQQQQQKRMLT